MQAELIVHGGAWDIPEELWAAHRTGVAKAHQRGLALLSQGAAAVDAAVAAVRVMEEDATFDAGIGSFLNAVGEVELDACVMDGRDLSVGAVAAVRRIESPIELARDVLRHSEHVLLVGAGAESWGVDRGHGLVDPETFIVDREKRRYQDFANGEQRVSDAFGGDTVAAIAKDVHGHLAVATSTGGAPYKTPGRVGDTPIPGAGCYADDERGAVAVSGQGEFAIRLGLAHRVLEALDRGQDLETSIQAAIDLVGRRLGGKIGIMAMDPGGRTAFAFNTPRMATYGF